jgi:uncharacterized protein (DUF1800 family)
MYVLKGLIHRIAAVILTFATFQPALALPPAAVGPKQLSESQQILHVLNRLGYGPRPGDVEKVRAMGLRKYIDQQLNPAGIDDAAAEEKLKRFEVFGMTTAQIFAKYPNPAVLLQAVEGQRRNAQAPQGPVEMSDAERRSRQQKIRELYRKYDLRPAAQLMPQIVGNRVMRAVYSERQLQEVMVDFWQNHFNVFIGKNAVRWYIPSYERDVLRPNALGKFRDLVLETARHPAMLFYLDNFQSVAPRKEAVRDEPAIRKALREGTLTARQREMIKRRQGLSDEEIDQRAQGLRQAEQRRAARGINENYARELMELHTLGVDGGYTQKDIVEVARAFTGWTIADPRGYRRSAARMITGEEDQRFERRQRMAGVPAGTGSGQFYFNPQWHDNAAKTVLGQKISEGGVKDGLKVIDILARHPSTARHIARKLAVKFVRDDPSEALVNRVGAAFTRSDGDIRSTLRALFEDKEFFAPDNYRAKIKSPFEVAVSAIRAVGGQTNGGPAIAGMLNRLGEIPYGYQAPTGYPDKAENWVSTGALLERLNFAVALASNRIPGTTVGSNTFKAETPERILEMVIAAVLAGEVSAETRLNLARQMERPLPEAPDGDDVEEQDVEEAMPMGRQARSGPRLLPPSGDPTVFKAVSLVLGSPEFQRQ